MLAHLKRGFPHQKIFLSKKFCLIKFETYIPEESRTVCDCKWRHPEQCVDVKKFFFIWKFKFYTWQRDRYLGRMWEQRQVEQGGQQGRSRGSWNMILPSLTSTSKKSALSPCCWTHKSWCGWGRRQEGNVPKYGILTLYQLAVYGTAPAASQHEVKCFSMHACTFDDWMHWALSG